MNDTRRPNIKDVAALAGTSVATASRVLNQTGYTARETRSRVLKAAEAIKYQPNLRAKGLRRGSTRTIGILIPNLENAHYVALADVISQLLAESGYQLLLSSTRDDPTLEWNAVRSMVGHDVDGLIWVPTECSPEILDYVHSQKVPAISLVRRFKEGAIDTVVFEDFQGSKAATQHLIQLGHQRIGFIAGDIHYSSNHDRWQGYQAALREAGLPVDPALVKLGPVRSSWGSVATNELLPLFPTALFVASNAIMAGVIKTLHQHKIEIPNQLSLIGFDDLDWFSYSSPPISAVAINAERSAEAAVDLLMRRLQEPYNDQRQPVILQLSFELVIRESTAPLK